MTKKQMQENIDLHKIITKLKLENEQKAKTISRLNTVSLSMSSFKNLSSILKDILDNIQNATNCDGGTIYLVNNKKLEFKHIVNKSLNIANYDCDEISGAWDYLDIDEDNMGLVAVHCAIEKEVIVIDDIYTYDKFDFSGTKSFDSRIGYRSHTMLVVPMLLADNTIVGVLQLINKLDNDGNSVLFNELDIELAKALSSQASVVINRYKQEKMMIDQSKLAAMGEMIDAVAHQWKQPLNIINVNIQKIDLHVDMGKPMSEDKLIGISKQITTQVEHLVTTLDEFRTFLRPSKNKQFLSIRTLIESSLGLLKDDIKKHEIAVDIVSSDEITIEVVTNEFKHILINMINNAKDAFIDNEVEDRRLVFNYAQTDETITITVEDNAGGIEKNIIDTLFLANTSTKSKGTGIGLYMSSQIAKKNGAKLSVENTNQGAKFTITLDK